MPSKNKTNGSDGGSLLCKKSGEVLQKCRKVLCADGTEVETLLFDAASVEQERGRK